MKKASIILLFCLFGFLSFTTNAQSNCTYTFNPASVEMVGYFGGSRSFDVVTQAGCSWTAVSNESWIVITSGKSGVGTGKVNFSVAQSQSSNQQREGTITVNGQRSNLESRSKPFLQPLNFESNYISTERGRSWAS